MTIFEEIMTRIKSMPADFAHSDEGRRFLATILPLTSSEIGRLKAMDLLPEIGDVDSDAAPVFTLAALAERYKSVAFAPGRIRHQGDTHRLY